MNDDDIYCRKCHDTHDEHYCPTGDKDAELTRLRAELAEARAALSGRTVSCSQCNVVGAEVAALKAENARMREAFKPSVYVVEAHESYWDGNRAPWVFDRLGSYASYVIAALTPPREKPEQAKEGRDG